MPICRPCAEAADAETRYLAVGGTVPLSHVPEICRDHGRAGCPCAHRPVGTATDQNGTQP